MHAVSNFLKHRVITVSMTHDDGPFAAHWDGMMRHMNTEKLDGCSTQGKKPASLIIP